MKSRHFCLTIFDVTIEVTRLDIMFAVRAFLTTGNHVDYIGLIVTTAIAPISSITTIIHRYTSTARISLSFQISNSYVE